MPKKYLYPLIVIILTGLAYAGGFWYRNLRGVGPAISRPSENIADIIEEQNNQKTEAKPGTNSTGFPLKMPDGFSISIFARNVPNARVMLLDPKGRMLVSQPSQGKVVVLANTNDEPAADEAINILSNLKQPHGMAFDCASSPCRLYVAETNQVAIYDYDADKPAATNKRKILDLPSGGGHFTRTIIIKDQKLFISIGSSCNVCNEADNRRATIMSANLDGSDAKIFASGLRNSVFMTLHPVDGKIWATDMGRDLLGDNVPPDEINIVEDGNPSTGSGPRNYGWPICYDDNIHDTNFDKKQYIRDPCSDAIKPKIKIQAHSAPLGLAFIPEDPAVGGWPEGWHNDLLVAYHGSWNRSVPTGYKVIRYKLDEKGNLEGSEDFITGWLTGVKAGDALGRPVDILVQTGGIIFISDDKAGLIYRLEYKE